MRMDIIGGADAGRLVADFGLKTCEPRLPVATVGRALAALELADDRKEQLVGIELGGGLGDAFALLHEQLRERARLGLAALGQLYLDLPQALAGQALERRQEVGDVALDQRLHAGGG